MIFLGLEIVGVGILIYGLKELLKKRNTSDNTYQPPPPIYENINQAYNNNYIYTEPPPSYDSE